MHGTTVRSLALLFLLLVSSLAVAPLAASAAAKGPAGSPLSQLSHTNYSNCFFTPPETGNPLFGDPQAWGYSTAWAPCSSLLEGSTPSNFTYSYLNYTTGSLKARTVSQKSLGFPSGSNEGLWYYRGQVVVQYTVNQTLKLSSYDTAGFSVSSGNKYTVSGILTDNSGTKLVFCDYCSDIAVTPPAFAFYDSPSPEISGTHPTVDGSSAVVAIAYQVQVPAQNITDSTGGYLADYPAQYSAELVKFSNGQWAPYEPTTGPSPSEYSVVTLSCDYTDQNGNPASYQYKALEQTKAPIAVISSGYAGFAYMTADYSVEETSCVLPRHYQTNLDLNVGDLNVGNVAHTVESFSPPAALDGRTPEDVTTCTDAPPCFGSFVGMWGNLLIYKVGDGTLRLLDTLRPAGGNNDFKLQMDTTFPAGDFPGKSTDGASMVWYTTPYWQTNTTADVLLWNGNLGIFEHLANRTTVDLQSFPKAWVDGRWASWINGSGANYTFNFYDVYNNTVAYLKHPLIYRQAAPNVVVGGYFSAVADFQGGLATWVSDDKFVKPNGFLADSYNLHWYNVTLASEGRPATGSFHLPWDRPPSALVSVNGWAYLTDMPNGTNYAQVFAVQLPTTLLALSAAGPGSATFGISGNVTSSQVTKATFVPDSTGRVSRLDLTVSGKSGTVGNMTITMPRSSVAGGVVPDVQVNGVRAAQQSYTEDSTNYYVNVLVHFSTDQVSVLFSAPSGTGATTSPATTSGGQTTAVTTPAGSGNSSGGGIPEFPAQLVPAIVLAVLVVASYLALRRRAPT